MLENAEIFHERANISQFTPSQSCSDDQEVSSQYSGEFAILGADDGRGSGLLVLQCKFTKTAAWSKP